MSEERELPRRQEPDTGKNSADNASAEDLFSQMQDAFQSLSQEESPSSAATNDFFADGNAQLVTPPQTFTDTAPEKSYTGTLLIALMAVSGTLVVAALLYMFFLLGSDNSEPDQTLTQAEVSSSEVSAEPASPQSEMANAPVSPSGQAVPSDSPAGAQTDTPPADPATDLSNDLSVDRATIAPETQDMGGSKAEAPVIETEQSMPAAAPQTPALVANSDHAIAVPATEAIHEPEASAPQQNMSLQDTTADDAGIIIASAETEESRVASPVPDAADTSMRPASGVIINSALDSGKAVATAPNRWVINLASFADPENAGKLLAKLQKEGVACRSIEVSVAGQPWYRVYLPGFARVKVARVQMLLLSDKYGFKDTWIGKPPAATVE